MWVSKAIFCIIACNMYRYTNVHLGCSQVYNPLYKHGLSSLKRSLMKLYMSAQMIFLTLMYLYMEGSYHMREGHLRHMV